MHYNTLVEELFSCIPELKNVYEATAEQNLIDNKTGNHVVFGVIITPYIVELLKNQTEKNKITLKKFFSFFERMANSNDSKICEVLEFTVIENLIEEGKEILCLAHDYMLDATRESSSIIERYFIQ